MAPVQSCKKLVTWDRILGLFMKKPCMSVVSGGSLLETTMSRRSHRPAPFCTLRLLSGGGFGYRFSPFHNGTTMGRSIRRKLKSSTLNHESLNGLCKGLL